MRSENILKRLTGAIKNAIAWGVAWFVLAFVTILLLRTIGVVVPPSVSALDALGMAIKFGVMGGVTGGAFSIFISLFYRGRRLSEINWLRFGLGGAVVAGIFVPSFLVLANVLTGGPVPPFDAIRGDIIFSALFGGIAAGTSMWLAQRGGARPLGGGSDRGMLDAGTADPRRTMREQDADRRRMR